MKKEINVDKLKTQIVSFFSNLQFNSEEHSYKHGGRTLSSVSSVIKKFVEPFDAYRIAGFVAKKRSREEGILITREMILEEWNIKKNKACAKGNKAHYFGETFNIEKSIPTTPYEKAIVNFWDSLPEHIIPVMFELQMFSVGLGIAGTADIILYNTKTNKFIIADYKTNEDLFKNHKGQKLLFPFNTLLDSPYNKYQIQLSFYQLLLEQVGYDFQVEARVIIWLKPDGTFTTYFTQDWCKEILTTFIK